ncbi:MAG: hypothetical protein QOJ79_803 [Actinomycetota bacterium]|nr:hypothetical protein [Actinomycetota bacterium]
MELSGATTANWVAKSANLLVDGLGTPETIGLLLPLHWQTVVLLLAGVATSSRVVLAADAPALDGCDAAFVLAAQSDGALDAGVGEVVALSGHPLGLPSGDLPPFVLDYAREVPSYADHYGGPRPREVRVEVAGSAVQPVGGIPAATRLLTTLEPADPVGAGVLLSTLGAGASLVLLRSGEPQQVATAERATATAGITLEGLTRLA